MFFSWSRIRYWDQDPGFVFSQRPGSGSAFNVCGSETLENGTESVGTGNENCHFLRIRIHKAFRFGQSLFYFLDVVA